MSDIVIVGAGPVGMLLAGELARRDIDIEVLERRPEAGSGSRAIGIHAPVLSALEPSGVTEELLTRAVRVARGEARADGRLLGVVRFDRLPMRFPFVATLPQAATESVLAARAPEPLRGAHVTEVIPRLDGVHVRAAIGGRVAERTAKLVVVASGYGARDLVYRAPRAQAYEYVDRYLMTDAAAGRPEDAATAVVNLARSGVLESFPLPGGMRRFVAWDPPGADPDPMARTERLRRALAVRGAAESAAAVVEATAFGVRRYVAPQLRNGRVFAIGDTAHEVSPIGGQGMNLGLLDAVTLAPLLAEWIRQDAAPEGELRAWERRRVASARTAAGMATVNTALGRALPGAGHAARGTAVRAMLAPPMGGLFAKAYAMGFDRDA